MNLFNYRYHSPALDLINKFMYLMVPNNLLPELPDKLVADFCPPHVSWLGAELRLYSVHLPGLEVLSPILLLLLG